MSPPAIKICGLSTPETVDAAVEAGARYVGFVFYPPSPRAVSSRQAAELASRVPPGVAKVGLFVAPDDALLDEVARVVPLDMVQVHKVDNAERLTAIRARMGLPLTVAIPVSESKDVDTGLALSSVADMLLFDAKAAPGARLPGGNGVAFDWTLLSTRRIPKPWMLAGGLTPENVAQAVALTGANAVDVSSGVESEPGIKDVRRIAKFAAVLGVRRKNGTWTPPDLLLT